VFGQPAGYLDGDPRRLPRRLQGKEKKGKTTTRGESASFRGRKEGRRGEGDIAVLIRLPEVVPS